MKRLAFLGLVFGVLLFAGGVHPASGQYVIRGASSGQQVGSALSDSPLRTLFGAYTDAFFTEKVFVHLNKESYQEDEIMWLKAYRVEGATHSPQLYSGIVYAEIFDPSNKQIARLQLMKESTGFQGSFKIPPGAVSGYYTLTAYTYWMQNYPRAFYFSRRFYVQNPKDMTIRSSLDFEPDYARGKIVGTANFRKENGEPYHNAIFRVVPVNDGVEMGAFVGRANRDGSFRFELPLDSAVTDARISFDNGEAEKYSRNFKVPLFDGRLDVQFMPEGGHLLDGVAQRVGFKVVGADGKSVEADGTVTDGRGKTVATISTSHKGMGAFGFMPQAGEKYSAQITAKDGRRASVALPDVASSGVGIAATVGPGRFSCRAFSTAGFDYEGLNFVIQCRGKLLMWRPLWGPGEIDLSSVRLPEGIVHLFIVDDGGKIYSERLVLVNRDQSAGISVKGVKPSYGRRELVEAEIDLGGLGAGGYADLSVSVVDTRRSFAVPSDNIASYLLLSSDIKGTVEEPWYYFDTSVDASARASHADLVMMTQGWKRFDVGDIFRRKTPRLDFAVELGQSIAGRIVNRWNGDKKLENPKLTMLAPSLNRVWIIEPDTGGYFQVADVAFPNKTIFLISGMQKDNKSGRVEVVIDEHKFRPYTPQQYDRGVYFADAKSETEQEKAANDQAFNFYDSLAPKFYYDEHGQKVYLMRSAEVTARRKGDFEAEMWGDDLLVRVTPEDILDAGIYRSVRDWLMAQQGVEIVANPENDNNEEAVYINGKRTRFIVGGDEYINNRLWNDHLDLVSGAAKTHINPEDYAALNLWTWQILEMPMSAISRINIIEVETGPSSETSWVSREKTHYAITVRTKNLSGVYRFDKPSMFEFYPLGYNEPDEFYRPVYGTGGDDPEPDQRVALHWDPSLRTGPDGKTKISFYTNDIPSRYLMTIQGITSRGQPISSQTSLNIQN